MYVNDPSYLSKYVVVNGSWRNLAQYCWRSYVEVKPSLIPKAGNGLFATRLIKSGWIFCRGYYLTMMNDPLFKDNSTDQPVTLTLEMLREMGAFYDDPKNAEQHINMRTIYIPGLGQCAQAIRDIQPGEEIYRLYSYRYWVTEMLNSCLSTLCLSTIMKEMTTSDDIYDFNGIRAISKYLTERASYDKYYVEFAGTVKKLSLDLEDNLRRATRPN